MKQEQLRTMDGTIEKYCPHCQQWKNRAVDFSPKRGSNVKIHSWCRACCVKDTAEWRTRVGRWRTPLTGRIQVIMAAMIHQGTSLRSADIRAIYKSQNGKCCYTGIEMKLMSSRRLDPLIMSVDRIDSSLGYERSNVVLCCLGINQLKGQGTAEQMYTALRTLYETAQQMALLPQ